MLQPGWLNSRGQVLRSPDLGFYTVPAPATNGFQVWYAQIITNGSQVEKPEIEFEMVFAVPGDPALDRSAKGRTEEGTDRILQQGKNREEERVPSGP
jgi:hypothetical protein